MEKLTQQHVIAYNKKVEDAKTKAAQDKARKELAEQELDRVCAELTEILGEKITKDNLVEKAAAFEAKAIRDIESGTRLLEGLNQKVTDSLNSSDNSAEAMEQLLSQESTQATKVVENIKIGNEDLDSILGLD